MTVGTMTSASVRAYAEFGQAKADSPIA